MTLSYAQQPVEYAGVFTVADVATMSYGGEAISPSGQDSASRAFPTAYYGRRVETLNTADALFARIDELRRLPEDWDSYGAAAPNDEVAGWAKQTTRLADWLGLTPTAIVPSAEEGIGITFRRGGRYADLEIFNSGEVLAVTSDGSGAPHVWEVDRSEGAIVEALKAIRDYLW